MAEARAKKSNSIDMLHGPLASKIILFSIPLAITSILQQLLNSTDAMFAGQWLGSNALAAVGGVAPIISLFVALFVGLSVGVNVVIAVHIGHDDIAKIRGAVQTTAIAAVVCSIVLAVAGVASTDLILTSVHMPEEAWQDGAQYLHVYFVGIVFLVIYNFGSAVLRAKGDTRRPLYALAVAAVLNIVFDYAAVAVLDMGVFGIAVGTVVADAVCAAIIVALLLTEEEDYRLVLRGARVIGADLKTMVHIGFPAALQGAVFALSNIIIQGEINVFGADATAGSSAAMNFEFYTYFFVNAFSQAAVTFIGQNYAARNLERCDKVMRFCMAAAFVSTLSLSLLFTLGGDWGLAIFTTEAGALTYGYSRLWHVELLEFMPCSYEVTASGMRGMGWSVLPTVVVIIGSCLLRIVYVFTLYPLIASFDNLMLIYPVTWVVTGSTMIALFFYVRKRAFAKQGV